MLDPYISKEDVMRLLNRWSDLDGLINRIEFQTEVTRLRQYKKPQNKKKFKVNNAHDILQNIAKYSNSSHYKEKYSKRRKRLGVNDDENIRFTDINTGINIEEWSIVEAGTDLAEILGITVQTVTKWKDKGIIERYYGKVSYCYGAESDECYFRFGYYYNLNKIREAIMRLK